MGEDKNIISDEYQVNEGNLQTLQNVNPYKNEEPSTMCAVVLGSNSELKFVPLEASEAYVEEIVYYDSSQDDVKVEIDSSLDVYRSSYSQVGQQSDYKPVRPKNERRNSKVGPHVCSVCSRQFSQLVNLITHERIHTGEKPFKCGVCMKSFTQQPNLWKHMRTHTGERPYQCSTCKKRFTQQANLKKHIRVHTGERPYKCQYCGKGFTQQANLTKHIRLHTGERPFHCRVCPKKFVQQSNLERHERTHSGVKPFKCKVCGDCFAQNAHLNKHMRSVHKNMVQCDSFVYKISSSCKELIPTTISSRPQAKSEFCDPSQTYAGIPVLYCTKTQKILKRVE